MPSTNGWPEPSAVYLVKVPDPAPPYDCQVHGARCPVGAVGLQPVDPGVEPFGARGPLPGVEPFGARGPLPGTAGTHELTRDPGPQPGPQSGPRSGPESGPQSGPRSGAESGPQSGPRSGPASGAAPEGTTAAWPRQMAVAIVETLAGLRPDRQLIPLTTDRVRARIRGLAPFLRSDRRPRIARIVASRPTAGVVEMTVVVDFGPRSRALAMRFEHVAGRQATPGRPQRPARWLCTAIEAG